MNSDPDDTDFRFKTKEDADAFRETIYAAGLRYGRPIYWHDREQAFPKRITGASCFFLRFSGAYVGVTAAHVVREYQMALNSIGSLVCQLYLEPFDLDGALIDIDDEIDIATFSISERQWKETSSNAFDVSLSWPPKGAIARRAKIQLIGYPENIRLIDPIERTGVFQAWGALGFVEDISDREIIVVYDPKTTIGTPTRPPLGYNMSGCSGGPAIIHEDRNGLHLWHPVGLIIGGSALSQGEATEFDMIRIRRIDCIEVGGRIRRSETGWQAK